jgi:hypothetical protein
VDLKHAIGPADVRAYYRLLAELLDTARRRGVLPDDEVQKLADLRTRLDQFRSMRSGGESSGA